MASFCTGPIGNFPFARFRAEKDCHTVHSEAQDRQEDKFVLGFRFVF